MQLFGATLKLKPWSVCSVPVRAGFSVVAYLQRIGSQNWEPLNTRNTRNAAFWGHIEIKTLVFVSCARTGGFFRGRLPATHWKLELGTTEYTEYTECSFLRPH
jgi:hypothetical protein